MKLPLLFSLALAPALLATPSIATAQNLLTINPSFESNTQFVNNGSGAPVTDSTSIPGWLLTIVANNFVGTANYSPSVNLDGNNAAYLGTGSSFMTLSGARAPITAGGTYQALGFARTDSAVGNTSSGTLTLSFYDGNAGGSTLLSSVSTSFNLPAYVSNVDPFVPESIVGLAPAGAAFAGLTYLSTSAGGNFSNIDNFQINSVPEPSTYAIALGGFGLFLAARRFRGTARV